MIIYIDVDTLLVVLMRATNIMIVGKVVLVCGYGDVGKGCGVSSMVVNGDRVIVLEIDPLYTLKYIIKSYYINPKGCS